ncbi:glutathione S-transferase 2-like isoform X2 [Lycium barbarum]|uniref:glutathione S-transferase 2-like isoform X2 n=1 Tax=Lycium barbarum TaxID=112863 RepID=UPI00293E70C1|nr:glutathione S-transferase 2-like isoform X2 [Lycium barbarum]
MTGSVEESKKLQLYSYWRSSCAFRVRIALNLKGLEYEYKAVNLLKGEQTDPVIADSFAIIMYLEEKYPQRALLPQDLQKRAINYQAANIVAANIQPLQNLAVLNYIQEKVGPNETTPWLQTHIRKGFEALEKLLKDYAGKYATGDEIYVADLFLAPQIYAAVKRIEIDMYTLGCLCLYRHPSVCMRVIFVSTHFLVLKEHGTIKNL